MSKARKPKSEKQWTREEIYEARCRAIPAKITDYLNKIICAKSEEFMKTMPSESVGLIFTSPPYNLKAGGGFHSGNGGNWKASKFHGDEPYDGYTDALPHDEYVEWQRACLKEMLRLLTPEGAIFYNHKWIIRNKRLIERHDILEGFPLRQILIWDRNTRVSFCGHFFVPQYEVIYIIAKDEWRPHKDHFSQGDIWRVMPENDTEHPAPFPLALARKVIAANYSSVVLDPFMGSGTTALAAFYEGRRYIGIERSWEYIKMAENRIEEAKRQMTLSL